MKLRTFKLLLNKNIKEESLRYLLSKRKYKGSEINYNSLETSEYLLPNDFITTKEDQRLLFSLRNKMYRLSDDYHNDNNTLCICYQPEDLPHIYECKMLNENKLLVDYSRIYNGTIREQNQVLRRIKESLKKREDFKNK